MLSLNHWSHTACSQPLRTFSYMTQHISFMFKWFWIGFLPCAINRVLSKRALKELKTWSKGSPNSQPWIQARKWIRQNLPLSSQPSVPGLLLTQNMGMLSWDFQDFQTFTNLSCMNLFVHNITFSYSALLFSLHLSKSLTSSRVHPRISRMRTKLSPLYFFSMCCPFCSDW